jgi:hypothetical protein
VSRRTGVWRSFSSNAAFDTKGKPGKTLPGFFCGKQKPLPNWVGGRATRTDRTKSFLVLFFKKELLFLSQSEKVVDAGLS